MTRKEAIKQLELYRACMLADWAEVEAYDMAINALELLTSYEHTIVKLMRIIKENEVKDERD